MKRQIRFTLRTYTTVVSAIACCSYVAGHATAMHQHASLSEKRKMLCKKDGSISKIRYVGRAFKDFYKMMEDPLGYEVELD